MLIEEKESAKVGIYLRASTEASKRGLFYQRATKKAI